MSGPSMPFHSCILERVCCSEGSRDDRKQAMLSQLITIVDTAIADITRPDIMLLDITRLDIRASYHYLSHLSFGWTIGPLSVAVRRG